MLSRRFLDWTPAGCLADATWPTSLPLPLIRIQASSGYSARGLQPSVPLTSSEGRVVAGRGFFRGPLLVSALHPITRLDELLPTRSGRAVCLALYAELV